MNGNSNICAVRNTVFLASAVLCKYSNLCHSAIHSSKLHIG